MYCRPSGRTAARPAPLSASAPLLGRATPSKWPAGATSQCALTSQRNGITAYTWRKNWRSLSTLRSLVRVARVSLALVRAGPDAGGDCLEMSRAPGESVMSAVVYLNPSASRGLFPACRSCRVAFLQRVCVSPTPPLDLSSPGALGRPLTAPGAPGASLGLWRRPLPTPDAARAAAALPFNESPLPEKARDAAASDGLSRVKWPALGVTRRHVARPQTSGPRCDQRPAAAARPAPGAMESESVVWCSRRAAWLKT